MIETKSLCPKCKKIIPAIIVINDVVKMVKDCSEHGLFTGVVESDPDFYMRINAGEPVGIYDGYFLDITNVCNIKCKYCYHPNGNTHRDVNSIVDEALKFSYLGPILLTGGEPTTHPDLYSIINILCNINGLEVIIITNGINLNIKTITNISPLVSIGLSLHKESNGADIRILEQGIKLSTVLAVIDDLSDIDELVVLAKKYNDVIPNIRIKIATNLWNETKVKDKLFTSDVLKYLSSIGETNIIKGANNKTSIIHVEHEGFYFMIVCWYDLSNVDLIDIDCGPYYMTKSGIPQNLAIAGMLNGN
jgi:uncharacterized radical SAM superfamily Fe-S cluster-containing enzyme